MLTPDAPECSSTITVGRTSGRPQTRRRYGPLGCGCARGLTPADRLVVLWNGEELSETFAPTVEPGTWPSVQWDAP